VWLLFGAVGLVMLMACANVANLLLARTMGRRREFEIRCAIGCSRTRLVRQILTESTVLFVLGGATALGIAKWTTVLLATYATAYAGKRVPLDWRALAFAAAVTLVTGAFFGLIPALRSRAAMSRAVEPHRSRARGVLIASEFALALIVLAGFGLLMRSFLSVQSAPLGFRAENLLTAETTLRDGQFKDKSRRIELVRRLLESVRAIPGVQSAAMTSSLPLSGADATRVRIEGHEPTDPRGDPVRYVNASAGLLETLEIPLIDGAGLSEQDSGGAEPVVVINQTMARMFFAGGAVGRRIQMEDEPGTWRKVVGVAGDIRQRNLEEDSRPLFYRPYPQGVDSDIALIARARSESDLGALARALRKAVVSVEPRQPWGEWKSMRQVIYDSESLTLRRPIVAMLGAFGLLAVLLASAGLYAVLSYCVTERTREIGIRLALGSQRSQLLRKILGDAVRMAAPGVTAGAVAAYELSSLLPSGHIGWSGSGVFLYGVTRIDAVTYVSAVLILGSVSVLATLVPARRAIRVDPIAALRHE
jgi:predicted permease